MSSAIKEWITENVPMVSVLYQNKYVGMLYDRFASLPPKRQRSVVLWSFIGAIAFILGYLFISYLSLWSHSSRARKASFMVNMLQQYQKEHREKSAQIQVLEMNNELATNGALKQHILDQGRMASISPRMLQVEEKDAAQDQMEDPKSVLDMRMKQASVKLQRVNLKQLRDLLRNIESGRYNLNITSLKILNDDKIRGYMNVEMSVVVYLFAGGEEET